MTQAVTQAIRERLERIVRQREAEGKTVELPAIGHRCAKTLNGKPVEHSDLAVRQAWAVAVMRRTSAAGFVLALLFGVPLPAFSQDSAKRDYMIYCSNCHGVDGRGNGPAVKFLPGTGPPDLTTLTQRHHGQFPEEEVRNIIDGRKPLSGHNDLDTDMPFWGLIFQEKGKEFTPESEAEVTRRVNALVSYVRSIQRR